MTDDERSGPFDSVEWPEQLRARIVTPGAQPHIRGYDVEGDIARHYSFAEGVLLALGGDPPTEQQGRAFEIAMHFLSPAPVNEAPVHAAVLARLCSGSDAGVIGTAAVGLVEQARWNVEQYADLLAWLEAPLGPPPAPAMSQNPDDRSSVDRLREALVEVALDVPALAHDLGRTAALLATMHACGLKRPHAIESAWVIARLATTVAEAMTHKRRGFLRYPMMLPPIRYEEEPR